MRPAIGCAVRDDGDGITIRLGDGPRRGRYRVGVKEVPTLLAGYPAVLTADSVPVGDLVASRSLRVLLGGFRDGRGFVEAGTRCPVERTAFLVPRAHLAAHYHLCDSPIPVLHGGA
jgi:hypothetical protein